MPVLFSVSIADLHLQVEAPPGIHAEIQDPVYQNFLKTGAGPEDVFIRVRIDLQLTGREDMAGWPLIFDSGGSWRLHGREGGYRLVFGQPEESEPVLLLETSHDFRFVRLIPGGGPLWLDASHQRMAFPLQYPVDQVLLLHALSLHRGLIIHGTGIESGGKAYLFAGISGAGKTTLARLLDQCRAGVILSDDRMILRAGPSGEIMAYGTPWPGDGGYACSRGFPLARICFLQKGPVSSFSALPPASAFARLVPAVSLPWYLPGLLEPALATCNFVLQQIPALLFQFRPDRSAGEAFRGLAGAASV